MFSALDTVWMFVKDCGLKYVHLSMEEMMQDLVAVYFIAIIVFVVYNSDVRECLPSLYW